MEVIVHLSIIFWPNLFSDTGVLQREGKERKKEKNVFGLYLSLSALILLIHTECIFYQLQNINSSANFGWKNNFSFLFSSHVMTFNVIGLELRPKHSGTVEGPEKQMEKIFYSNSSVTCFAPTTQSVHPLRIENSTSSAMISHWILSEEK